MKSGKKHFLAYITLVLGLNPSPQTMPMSERHLFNHHIGNGTQLASGGIFLGEIDGVIRW